MEHVDKGNQTPEEQPKEQSKIIQYLNILKASGHPEAKGPQEFLEANKGDKTFVKRAKVLGRAYLIDSLRPKDHEAKGNDTSAGRG